MIDLTDTDALESIKHAQLEQGLHEIRCDLDELQASQVALGGLINVKLDNQGERPQRFSKRALGMLRPYMRGRSYPGSGKRHEKETENGYQNGALPQVLQVPDMQEPLLSR